MTQSQYFLYFACRSHAHQGQTAISPVCVPAVHSLARGTRKVFHMPQQWMCSNWDVTRVYGLLMTQDCWLVSRISFIISCGLSLHSYNAISSTVALGLHFLCRKCYRERHYTESYVASYYKITYFVVTSQGSFTYRCGSWWGWRRCTKYYINYHQR